MLKILLITFAAFLPVNILAHKAEKAPKGFSSVEIFRQNLHDVPGKEVIFSLVTVPEGMTAPWHYHPGEEFAYLIEGEATTLFKKLKNQLAKSGSVSHIPFKEVHSVKAGKGGLKAIVVRIHSKGEPERVLVNDKGR